MTMKKKLLIALVLPQLAGAIGGLLTAPAISSWYQYLAKPAFSPPNWLLVPYLLWVSFAAYLNFSIFQLNFL